LVLIMAFNYLIGNHDAHGKNFSIIHEQEIEMAPFYDLISAQVYPNLEGEFAMAIGQTFRYDRVKEHSFVVFAKDLKIRPRKLGELMGGMVESVSNAYEPILSTHEKEYGPSTIYQDLFKVIQVNLEHLESLLDRIGV
ncbi:MAG: HipA domain-containing protein, partial [Desulfobacula sp.]|nr:HipA domain-containing protein [Desulfobacula sp.]